MKRHLDALAGSFDLAVLGGGITGAGVALDAALRGLRVALIERGDFASGTSSLSTKLVHGGLRYLETGQLRLVYEALHERARLLANAPHLVWPLRFVIPFYQGGRIPAWKWRAGLVLYDVLAGPGNLLRSRPLSPRQARQQCPGLRPDGLRGGAAYADAQMDDARLCLEVIRTAVAAGAAVANHVEAVALEREGGAVRRVRAVDRLSGREVVFRAEVIVNATGPWGDEVRRLAGEAGAAMLAPTKGVHLVAADRGLSAGVLLLHPRDGRVFFALPWLGKTLVGTTDTDAAGPEGLAVTEEDIDYLLCGYNHHFAPPLERGSVLGTFAGVRPLLRAGAAGPSARPREDRLVWGPTGMLSVAGGKYTTYRRMAERVTDAVMARLGRRGRCRTRRWRLDGAPEGEWRAWREAEVRRLRAAGLSEASARHLVGRYGRRAGEVAEYALRDTALARPVVEGEPELRAELAYGRDHEMACTDEDVLLRRTRLGLFRPALLRAAGRGH